MLELGERALDAVLVVQAERRGDVTDFERHADPAAFGPRGAGSAAPQHGDGAAEQQDRRERQGDPARGRRRGAAIGEEDRSSVTRG